MSIITIHAEKGGTGKTTLCANLAARLTADGLRVLMIDTDPQANLSFYVTGTAAALSLYDIFKGTAPGKVIQHTEVFGDIIPSAAIMSTLSTMRPAQLRDPFAALCQALSESYDHIIIDCPPMLGTLTVIAYSVSDKIIIPVTPSLYCLQSLHTQADFIKAQAAQNPQLTIAGIAVNLYDPRRTLHRQALEAIADYAQSIQVPVYSSHLRSYSAYEYATLVHKPVFTQGGNAAADMAALCAEIVTIL